MVCRDTLAWKQQVKILPFESFTSHTANAVIMLYSCTPYISKIDVTLRVSHTICQGLHVNCHHAPIFFMDLSGQALHGLNSIGASANVVKISMLEITHKEWGGECIDLIAPIDYENTVHENYYVKDSTAAWCTTFTKESGKPYATYTMNNFNMYLNVGCLKVQNLPSLWPRTGQRVNQCRITFHDPQSRLQDGSILINTTFSYYEDHEEVQIVRRKLKLDEVNVGYEYTAWISEKLPNPYKYFTVSLTTKIGTVTYMTSPLLDTENWYTLPYFQTPIVGTGMLSELSHTVKFATETTQTRLLAHTDQHDYMFINMYNQQRYLYKTDIAPSWKMDKLQGYKIVYYLAIKTQSVIQCDHLKVAMNIIQQSGQPLFGFAYHRISLNLLLNDGASFTYQEFILIYLLENPPR